jgi:caa(3)-type oxidase subunit IV
MDIPASSTVSGGLAPAEGGHPSRGTYGRVWAALVALTLLLAGVSRIGPRAAAWAMLTITPVKAGLVLFFFMNLWRERPAIKVMVVVALLTFINFIGLMFVDVAFR